MHLFLWQGTAENQGDLKSVVLHKMAISAQRNTFPIALGVRVTGVDNATYSQTGESYSTISLPNTTMHTERTLQEDDTALAYEFARKFPGVSLFSRFRSPHLILHIVLLPSLC